MVPFIRPQFGLSYYGSPRVIEPTYGVSTADIQQALAERGFYYGPIDGDFGPMTQRAIATFQSEAGLPVTGEIDGSLLRALDL